MTAQTADDSEPLVIAADYNSTRTTCAKMIARFHFILLVWLEPARRNAHRRPTLPCSRDISTQRASREVGSGDKMHQRSITPTRRRSEEMQTRDIRLKVSVQNWKAIGTADRRQQLA